MADKQRQPESANGAESPQEFSRFQNLMRKLVKVPKDELDEKRKQAATRGPSARRT